MLPCFFDLSARAKLRVTGADRVRFLNGQTTNDVRKSSGQTAQETCLLNVKGHLDAHLFLFATEDAIWIDADEELRERLPARLDRYVIADDVVIEDVTEDFGLFHVLTQTTPQILKMKFCLSSRRLLDTGWDVWSAAIDAPSVKQALSLQAEFLDPTALEIRRIENGIARWDRELSPDIIPPEAGLEQRAIDYDKGCYIGQEVISRMKMSGQMRQRLCGLKAAHELARGMELRGGERAAGKITSTVFSERLDAHIGLAMIKRQFTAPGTALAALAADRSVDVVVAALPFPR